MTAVESHRAPSSTRALIRKAVASHPEEMADVMASLAWSVHDEDELLEYLQRCAGLAVRVIDGAHSAGVTAHVGSRPFTAAHTDPRTLAVDARQYEVGDGPCLTALRDEVVVAAGVEASRERWPAFATDAAEVGVLSFLAAPLTTMPTAVGALNLYSTRESGFEADDITMVLVIADYATRALDDYGRLVAAEDLAAQLQQALKNRAPIEQAKGILMAARSVDEDEAFEILRRESQHTNTKLHTVAVDFVRRHSGSLGLAEA